MQKIQKLQRLQEMQRMQEMQTMQRLQKMQRLPRLSRLSSLNSKTSQNVKTLGLFEKNMGFWEKTYFFFKFAKSGNIAVECASNGIISYKRLLHPSYKFLRQKIKKL